MDIAWQKKYEVGNLEIDAEHQVFVKIIQKIGRVADGKTSPQYTERLLLELCKYADFHFCSEENVMFAAGYPDIERHKNEPKILLVELKDLISSFADEGREMHRDMAEVINFLMRWFTNHTTQEDLKLAAYLALIHK